MSHEARFLPTSWLHPVPLEPVSAQYSMTAERIRIQGDLDRFYSTRQALETGDASVYTVAGGVAYMYWRMTTLEHPYFQER
jgi:hypothetical protein